MGTTYGLKTVGKQWLFEHSATHQLIQQWIVTRFDNPTVSYYKNRLCAMLKKAPKQFDNN